jgi:hypothetical protein
MEGVEQAAEDVVDYQRDKEEPAPSEETDSEYQVRSGHAFPTSA